MDRRVKLLAVVLCLLFGVGVAYARMTALTAGQSSAVSGGGGPTYTCVGFENSCTPSTTPATESAATNADRHYARPFTATESKTAVSIFTYISFYEATASWVALYRQDEGAGNHILIGKGTISSPTIDTWQEWTLVAEDGQNLNYDDGDVLNITFVFDNYSGTTALGRNDTGGPGLNYMTNTITTPLTTITSWTNIASRDMALILKSQ